MVTTHDSPHHVFSVTISCLPEGRLRATGGRVVYIFWWSRRQEVLGVSTACINVGVEFVAGGSSESTTNDRTDAPLTPRGPTPWKHSIHIPTSS